MVEDTGKNNASSYMYEYTGLIFIFVVEFDFI